MPAWLMVLFGLMALSPVAAFQTFSPSSKTLIPAAAQVPASTQPVKPAVGEHCLERWQTTFADAIGAGALEPNAKQGLATWLGGAKALNLKYEVFIATIPDPIDSGFAYMFQTHLQALRLGIEEGLKDKATYYRTQSWLPWHETVEAKKSLSEPCRRELPGVVLFRGQQENQAAVLLLVGETPTFGVHARAMNNALEIAAILGKPETKRPGQISILGPTFSGSASSIKAALGQFANGWAPSQKAAEIPPATPSSWTATLTAESGASSRTTTLPVEPKGKWTLEVNTSPSTPEHESPATATPSAVTGSTSWHVRLVTGTASAPGLKEMLASPAAGGYFGAGEVDFSTTTIPESILQCRYFYFLKYSLHTRAELATDEADAGGGPGRHEILPEVALLHESGTEFGARQNHQHPTSSSRPDHCLLQPKVEATFPANVAGLRDAYEATDINEKSAQRTTRRTSLDVSLHESRLPPGVESEPSGKAIVASDVALARIISAIGHEGVRHVAIQATEPGDAIFLSRKIRDVAPDVRIAIFQADALLLHPNFQALLRGSLVVTPYPFLGASQLKFGSSDDTISFRPFENSAVQGVFNAVLALRGAKAEQLREYALERSDNRPAVDLHFHEPRVVSISDPGYNVLPVWIAAVGARGFVPLLAAPSVLREEVDALIDNPIYPGLSAEDTARLSQVSAGSRRIDVHPPAWQRPVDALNSGVVDMPFKQRRSRVWGVLTLLACGFFLVDHLLQRRARPEFPRLAALLGMGGTNDRLVELATLRMKWNLYATVRSWVGVSSIVYSLFWAWESRPRLNVASADAVASFSSELVAFRSHYFYLLVGAAALVVLVCLAAIPASRMFVQELAPFLRMRATRKALKLSRWGAVLLHLGWHRPERPQLIAYISKHQALVLAYLVVVAFVGLAGLQVWAIHEASDILGTSSRLARTLVTERTINLTGGASVAAPTLLLLGIFYMWTVSRMARLRLIYAVARMTPPDGVADFVATPIRMILQPGLHLPRVKGLSTQAKARSLPLADSALTRIERSAMHAIARPITGLYYLGAWAGVMALPVVLFLARFPATLESLLGYPLILMLYLAYAVIACSLLQLVQYWIALELLLKSVFQHWLGRAFDRVAPFVQEPIDEQVSRTPNDLLRLAACVGEYENLRRWAHRPGNSVAATSLQDIETTAKKLVRRRERALESIGGFRRSSLAFREAALGSALVAAAAELSWIVEQERARSMADSQAPAGMSATYPKDNVAWIKDAEAFAATVVALLINRHVRQFQHFIYPLLVSTVLLLCAILSYPFEPHRLMKSFAWSLILLSVAAGVWTYLQLDRNSLLSKIAATQPGRITANSGLVFRLLAWGIVPLLAALAADYPDLVHSIMTWVAPGVGAR